MRAAAATSVIDQIDRAIGFLHFTFVAGLPDYRRVSRILMRLGRPAVRDGGVGDGRLEWRLPSPLFSKGTESWKLARGQQARGNREVRARLIYQGAGAMLDPLLAAFVTRELQSLWALDVLLCVKRSHPLAISLTELVNELRATTNLIDRVVAHLSSAGVVDVDDGMVVFSPGTQALSEVCNALAYANEHQPLAVRNAVLAGAPAIDMFETALLKDSQPD